MVHQYYELGDALVDKLLYTVTSAANQCREQVKEPLYQQRTATQPLTSQVTGRGYRHQQALTQIRALVDAPDVPAEQKLQRIDALLQRQQVTAAQLSEDHQHLEQLRLATEQQAATLSPFAVLSYRHLNLHGEYDFSDQPLPAEAPFDMDLITTWQPLAKPGQG